MDRLNTTLRNVPVWVAYLVGLLPVPWLFYQGATGGLGIEPISALEHELGKLALQLLILGLCVTPLRRHAGLNLMRFRRAIGLLAFLYVALHLLVWAVLDVQTLERVWADIIKRPYITIGMAGFLLMLPLALTSNNWSVRRLGPLWRRLHQLTYVVGLLGGLHYVWLAKGLQVKPLLYMSAIVGLLVLRLRWPAHWPLLVRR